MIITLLKAGWLNLKRDRVAQALTFVLPILFFSIFASVFGGQGYRTSRIRVAVVDEDRSELSGGSSPVSNEEADCACATADAERCARSIGCRRERMVRNGNVPVAVVIPKGSARASRHGSAPVGGRRCSCSPTCRTRSHRRWCSASCRR